MKFLKMTTTLTFEVAVPVADDTPVGVLTGDEAAALQEGAVETFKEQAKSMGGKLIDSKVLGEVVEI